MPAPRPLAVATLVLGAALLHGPAAGADERDAIIQDLQRRVEALEEKLKERGAPSQASAPSPQAPASSTVDEEDSARALERTLMRQGGLVLPAGQYELEPRMQYSYRGTDGLAIVDVAGQAQATNQVVRRNRGEATLGLRVGLPSASQAEIRLPYGMVREDRATAGTLRQTSKDGGVGDIELAYTKQLRMEQAGRSGLLGSVVWTIPTGDFRLGEPSVGSGFHSVQAALTAVKRQDPLVFFGTLSYTSVFERSHQGLEIDPGNPLGLRAGAILAASPQTSLLGGFELSRARMTRINGAKVPGTDAVSGTLQFGVATLLSPRALLDIQVGIGVTRDAPDFRITAALPIRFD
jgi:hypothetical protein